MLVKRLLVEIQPKKALKNFFSWVAVVSRLTAIVAMVLSLQIVAEGDETLTFERHIRPLLKVHCLDCHGATAEVEGGLDLRQRRRMVAGGESGAAIAPGEPETSLLIERIRKGEMPPGDKKMAAQEIATLEKWVAAGAVTAREEPEILDEGLRITPEEREFWSFQPIQRPALPELADYRRVRTPIDTFVLAKLQSVGLGFSPDADDKTLLMRAYFDLLGLPPSPAEVQAYLADDSTDKYETLLDTLLASPRYGERWARHWLDVAGYADSEGYTPKDADRPWAYKYRDYVIKSLNADKPFDVFVQEQLAGDELVPLPHKNLSEEQVDKLTATGFLRMASDGTGSGANDEKARNQTMADTIKIISTSLLGLSVGCAQCHDHRYDPIPHADYYQLRAIFEPALDWKNWRTPQQRRLSLSTEAERKTAAKIEAETQAISAEKAKRQKKYIEVELEKELAKYDAELREKLRTVYHLPAAKRSDEQKLLLKQNPSVNISAGTLYQYNNASADELKKLDQRINTIRAKKPAEEFLRMLTETPGSVPVTHLFYRGDFKQPKEEMAPAGLTIGAPPGERFEIAADDESLPTTGRRLAYARWLFSGKHPLVGRVLVNRFWMHHFGRGIVGTPSDYGALGQPPTHPKLLDWLASEFASSGWSLKNLHKQIMLSTVYRQASQGDPAEVAADTANLLYWKKPVIRIDAEVVQDRILATSGVLENKLYGTPVPLETDDTGQTIVSDRANRRSIYVKVKRTQQVALLKSFDAPVMLVNCEKRPSTTVATQSLMLLNSKFILSKARQFAERVRREASAVVAPDLEISPADTKATSLRDPVDAWQFGYGQYDPQQQQTKDFTPLPHWTGKAWQGGAELPDASLGWVLLTANGGHPGDAAHCAIRRWVAPTDGVAKINGSLHHAAEQGDGVSSRVVSNREGLVAEWNSHHNKISTPVQELNVQAGEVLDFLTDCRTSENSDSFAWSVSLELTAADGKQQTWASAADFHGPRSAAPALPKQIVYAWQLAYGRSPTQDELSAAIDFLVEQFYYMIEHRDAANQVDPSLQALTNLCQVLLSSNEFLYVD
ncbi:MAG: DUF1549 domain-containing protein [Planctomycetes bacterium]|nr:DUF1549 domain-containing protein [Planctomycetota bacterium]